MKPPERIDTDLSTIGWSAWIRWVVATTLAWIVGFIAAIVLSFLVVNLFYPKETNLIVGLCLGATVGLAQRAAVRRWLTLSYGWVGGAVVAMTPSFVAAVLLDEWGAGVVGIPAAWLVGSVGFVSILIGGWIQARALRASMPRANRWILASLVSWGLAWLGGNVVGLPLGGVFLGVFSGGLLIWLIRPPAATHTGASLQPRSL